MLLLLAGRSELSSVPHHNKVVFDYVSKVELFFNLLEILF